MTAGSDLLVRTMCEVKPWGCATGISIQGVLPRPCAFFRAVEKGLVELGKIRHSCSSCPKSTSRSTLLLSNAAA